LSCFFAYLLLGGSQAGSKLLVGNPLPSLQSRFGAVFSKVYVEGKIFRVECGMVITLTKSQPSDWWCRLTEC
jgi:hypothetical protein